LNEIIISGIFGTITSGYLIMAIGPKALFALITVTSIPVGKGRAEKQSLISSIYLTFFNFLI